MPAPDPGFSLLAASAADLRREGLPKALGRALGITAIDAGMILRRSRGILREGLAREEAERIAGVLGSAGVATRVIADAVVAALPPARALLRVEPTPSGLDVLLRAGGREVIPWERIVLLSVGPWQETIRTAAKGGGAGPTAGEMAAKAGFMAMTGLPVNFGRRKGSEPKAVVRTEFHLLLDLLLEGPEDRLWVDGNRCDYSGLGAAMAPTSLANLKALAAALAAALPGAARGGGTELLLAGGRLSALGYESEEDFLREQRWWWSLRRAES